MPDGAAADPGRRAVEPDDGRVGGVTEWMKVAHLAHAFNLPVAPHAVQLVHLHLACATPNLKVEAFDYLSRYPGLATDRAAVLDLIASEFGLRLGEAGLTATDYVRRFPGYGHNLMRYRPVDVADAILEFGSRL